MELQHQHTIVVYPKEPQASSLHDSTLIPTQTWVYHGSAKEICQHFSHATWAVHKRRLIYMLKGEKCVVFCRLVLEEYIDEYMTENMMTKQPKTLGLSGTFSSHSKHTLQCQRSLDTVGLLYNIQRFKLFLGQTSYLTSHTLTGLLRISLTN